MKKMICILLILGVSASAFAQFFTVTGSAPQTENGTVNTQLTNLFNNMKDELQDELNSLDINTGNFNNFAEAFGNAAVFASHGASQRNFSGYRLFNVSFGSIVGLSGNIYSDTLEDEILDGNFGANIQAINAQLGFNASFLKKNLYLGLRFGILPNISESFDSFSYEMKSMVIGVTANYQLIPRMGLPFGLLTWRGVNIGTGFIYQNTSVTLGYALDPFSESAGAGATAVTLSMNPYLGFNYDVTTFTIPLEVMTAVKILFINIPLGLGADIAFGSSEMSLGILGDIRVTGAGAQNVTPGYLSVNGSASSRPKFMNPKLMTGLGLSFGPVYIDVPITFYFGNGLSAGVTVGVSW